MENQLAACFVQMARKGKTLETTANGMFAPLKAESIDTLDKFNAKVSECFDANGWTRTTGRPAKGVKSKPVPDVVQVYVSRFRGAYKLGLDVLSFSTVYELREAVKVRRQVAHQHAQRPPELKGIQLSSKNRLIEGALFHNVTALWEVLPEDKQEMLYRQIEMVYNTYLKDAPADVLQAA